MKPGEAARVTHSGNAGTLTVTVDLMRGHPANRRSQRFAPNPGAWGELDGNLWQIGKFAEGLMA